MKYRRRYVLKIAGIGGWALFGAITLALLWPAVARAAGESTEPSGVGVGVLLAAMAVGWVGNLLHRIKKVVKAETDQAILAYLSTHRIIFIIGLVVAAAAVWVESATYARDWGSLMWSALLTGYGADSLLEAKQKPTTDR
jgi:hypothetical protein